MRACMYEEKIILSDQIYSLSVTNVNIAWNKKAYCINLFDCISCA
jgi:hypothetical protein